MNTTILVITTVMTALMAGLFYAWSISVVPGLAQINDNHYLHAFQSMNRAILNPAFFIPFIGLVLLFPLLAYQSYQVPAGSTFWYILAAGVLYLLGCIGLTFMGNVPLNNELEALLIDSMKPEQMATFRLGFENKWNQLNLIRTYCSSLSLILLVIACLQHKI